MNKAELVDAIAVATGASKAKVEAGLKVAVDAITKELKKGGTVQLIGFGTFAVKAREARKGFNPRTKEKIKIPKKKVPVFKAGAALKDSVAGASKAKAAAAPAKKAAPVKKVAAPAKKAAPVKKVAAPAKKKK
jgi:DNA-binding protein HU-beta